MRALSSPVRGTADFAVSAKLCGKILTTARVRIGIANIVEHPIAANVALGNRDRDYRPGPQ